MEIIEIKKYIGKRVLIALNNNFSYKNAIIVSCSNGVVEIKDEEWGDISVVPEIITVISEKKYLDIKKEASKRNGN